MAASDVVIVSGFLFSIFHGGIRRMFEDVFGEVVDEFDQVVEFEVHVHDCDDFALLVLNGFGECHGQSAGELGEEEVRPIGFASFNDIDEPFLFLEVHVEKGSEETFFATLGVDLGELASVQVGDCNELDRRFIMNDFRQERFHGVRIE